MGLRVVSDQRTLCGNGLDPVGMLRSVFAHHKEGRLNPLVVEDLQNRLGVLGRAVVKGEVAIFLSAAVVCGFGDGLIERGFRALVRRETLLRNFFGRLRFGRGFRSRLRRDFRGRFRRGTGLEGHNGLSVLGGVSAFEHHHVFSGFRLRADMRRSASGQHENHRQKYDKNGIFSHFFTILRLLSPLYTIPCCSALQKKIFNRNFSQYGTG